MKAKLDDEIETLVDISLDNGNRILPKGLRGTVVECYDEPQEGYAVDLAIPDQSSISGFDYENVILFPEQFELVVNEEKQNSQRSILDLVWHGSGTILSTLLPPIGGVIQVLQFSYFQENQKRLEEKIWNKFQGLDEELKNKIDRDKTQSNEFKGLAIQIVESAVKSSSEIKLEALATLFINSSMSKLEGEIEVEEMVVRTVSRMTDSEIVALYEIYSIEQENKTQHHGITSATLGKALGKPEEDCQLIMDGLLQNQLILESSVSKHGHLEMKQPRNKRQGFYYLSRLGCKIIFKSKKIQYMVAK